jgi:hypothetical protein
MLPRRLPHPIFAAVFDAWWLQRGIDPRWVRAMVDGRVPASLAFVEAIRKEFGIPAEAWPLLEPEYPAKKPTLRSRTHHVTIKTRMEAPTAPPPPRGKRSGPPLLSTGPFAIASVNSGQSMFQIAAAIGISYNAAKACNRRRSAQPWVRVLLKAPPYNVPDSAYEG